MLTSLETRQAFTEQQLKSLHKEALKRYILRARKYKNGQDLENYQLYSNRVKDLFFDKIYWKRGFTHNPTTNLYYWSF